MGAVLGKHKKQTKVTAQEKIVLRMKNLRDNLKQFQSEQELNVESDLNRAKQCLREGSKNDAKTCLRRKRYYEQQILHSQTQLDKIEQLIHELEFLQIENSISKIGKKKDNRRKWKSLLKRNNNTLRRRRSQVQVYRSKKKEDKVMVSTKNEIEKQKIIGQLISSPLKMEDDEAVAVELEEILDCNYPIPHVPTGTEIPHLEQSLNS